jgi:hypothetical protein
MAELAGTAANNTWLSDELEREREEAHTQWAWSTALTTLGVLIWLFRWGWAILAAHFPRFPKRDPLDRYISLYFTCNVLLTTRPINSHVQLVPYPPFTLGW